MDVAQANEALIAGPAFEVLEIEFGLSGRFARPSLIMVAEKSLVHFRGDSVSYFSYHRPKDSSYD